MLPLSLCVVGRDSGLFYFSNAKSVENKSYWLLYNMFEVIIVLRIPKDVEQSKVKMPAGGYVCRIVKAEASINRYNEPCLLLYLDVAEGDFKNYFGGIYSKRLDRGDNKYPCVYNQRVGNKSKKYFDQLMEAIQASNADYICTRRDGEDWDERELEGLLVGVVLQEKEFINSRGKVRVVLTPYEFKSVDEIRRKDFDAPPRRYE